ncbi:MAG TPA: hypothetical protein VK625_23190 [Flavitalea sp.]|nr:hypothetical protein [Flavitalea sp.]
MENDQLSTGEEGLAIIQSMINKAKNQLGDNGHLYLMWGWVVLVCSLTQFVILNFFYSPYHYMVWFVTWLAVIYQAIYLYTRKKKKRVKTYTDDIISNVWLVFVILMFLFGFLFGSIMGKDYYHVINPGFLALYGMPTFLSGIILKFRPLIMGGICCWILAMISAFASPTYHLLFLAAGVIIAWIIPGYIMRSKFKKQQMV